VHQEKLPEHWKESVIVSVYKKGDKTGYSNYRGISLLSTQYRILSNILNLSLIPHVDKIMGNRQCWCRRDRSTTHSTDTEKK
jgi:hypothetical protein